MKTADELIELAEHFEYEEENLTETTGRLVASVVASHLRELAGYRMVSARRTEELATEQQDEETKNE